MLKKYIKYKLRRDIVLDVDHCPRCNQLFRKNLRDICPTCVRDLEKSYETIYRFVRKRENREATIEVIEQHTKVDKEDIYRIIRAGRLSMNHFPNLGYPCETQGCNGMITTGRLCSSCVGEIKNGLDVIKREQERAERKKRDERSRIKTYQTVDDNRW